MPQSLKVANLLIIVLAALLLLYVRKESGNKADNTQMTLKLMSKVINNQSFSFAEVGELAALVYDGHKKLRDLRGPECLLRVYYQLYTKNSDHDVEIDMNLFDGQGQFDNIHGCSDYFALLTERYKRNARSSSNAKKAGQLLDDLQLRYYTEVYEHTGASNNKFCIVLRAKDSQKEVLSQIEAILSSNYLNFRLFVVDDFSSDNSYIFAKYYLDQLAKSDSTKARKAVVQRNSEPEGELQNFNHYFSKHCEDGQIILMLSGTEEPLGNNALHLLNKLFSNSELKMGSFRSLNLPYMNARGDSWLQQSQIKPQLAPIIAFRRELYDLIDRNWLIDENTDTFYSQYGRQILTFFLSRSAKDKGPLAYKHFDEILLRVSETRSYSQISRLNEAMVSRVKQIAATKDE